MLICYLNIPFSNTEIILLFTFSDKLYTYTYVKPLFYELVLNCVHGD
jgi:hypothetical protein